MARLIFNLDHIATLRQIRGGKDPDPVHAAVLAELAGCIGIAAVLRQDRKHIQERDLYVLKQTISTKLNICIGMSPDLIKTVLDVGPQAVTFYPEQREERVLESGLKIVGKEREIAKTIEPFHENNIAVCLYLDPDVTVIKSAARAGVTHVELHTGYYANATGQAQKDELMKLTEVAMAAHRFGLVVNAGHGLSYSNVHAVSNIQYINELHIGHSIISRSLFHGLDTAIRDMVQYISM
ncbi:MAG: pyridoxine 5'-phosphate synthase [Chitinivibrionales bacterium]|nr:pyridoxine 5'-phosphate synthase [Chitinivibrionales bacterium]